VRRQIKDENLIDFEFRIVISIKFFVDVLNSNIYYVLFFKIMIFSKIHVYVYQTCKVKIYYFINFF